MLRAVLVSALAALAPVAHCASGTPGPLVMRVTVAAPGPLATATETEVTRPIEEALAAVPGIVSVESESRADRASLLIAFPSTTDPLAAGNAVREVALGRLPVGSERSDLTVAAEPESEPVATVILEGAVALATLRSAAEELVRSSRSSLEGLGAIEICGGEREITVWVDPQHLAAVHLGLSAIVKTLREARVHSVEDLRALSVAAQGGMRITVSDVARVEDGLSRERCMAYHGDTPALSVAIRRKHGSDATALRAGLRDRLAELRKALPPGVSLTTGSDTQGVDVDIELPSGTSTERALTVAADAARQSGGLARCDTARPTHIHLRADDPAKLRGLDERPGITVRFPSAELHLGLTGDALDELDHAAADIARVAGVPGIAAGVEGSGREPTFTLDIDHNILAKLGVNPDEVTLVARAVRRGVQVGLIDDVAVRVRLPREPRDSLAASYVPAAGGQMVPLSAIARGRASLEPESIVHENGRRLVTVWLRASRSIDLLEVLALRFRIDAVSLPPGIQKKWP